MQYERRIDRIAAVIGRGRSLAETAGTALDAYVEHLERAGGAVFERRHQPGGDAGHEQIATVASGPAVEAACRTAGERLDDGIDLPARLSGGDRPVDLLALPGFGAVALVGEPLGAETVAALEPLNRTLADVCDAERRASGARETRSRFEAMFEALPEAVVDVADGVVRDVNPAFERTFGYERSAAVGRELSELIVPDSAATDADWAGGGEAVSQVVTRETADGMRTFTLRSVPVGDGDGEHLGLYVDVTEQHERERTLDQLYRVSRDFMESDDRSAVCQRAVEAAVDVLGFSTGVVYRYDRDAEALVPAETTGTGALQDRGLGAEYDRSSVVWSVYRSGEAAVVDDADGHDAALPSGTTSADSMLVFPLGDHGVFVTAADGVGAFDDSDQYFGQLLSTMLRTALDRVRRERTLRDVQRTTSALITVDDVETVCERLVADAAETFDLPIAAVWRHDPPADVLRPVAMSEAGADLFEAAPTFASGDSIARQVFDSGEPRLVDDVSDHPDAYNPDSVVQSEIVAPIGEFGVIAAGSRLTQDFSASELEILQTLATGAASALRLVEQRTETEILDQILGRVLRHNIRNDLTAITGRAELIRERAPEPSARRAEEILRVADRLAATSEHAREIRTVVDRREQRSDIDLAEAVARVVATVEETTPRADIVVEDGLDYQLRVHPDFDRAIRHAIENGVEHAEADDPTVAVGATVDEDALRIEIADEGPGIPDHEVEVLRAGEVTELNHATGIGLWIIDRIVAYSGGTVSFERSDDGTTVVVEFDRSVLVDCPE